MNYNTMSQLPKVYFQTNDDASFKIGFTDNQRYLNNGEVVFPKNSLGYIVDESELITLVKPCGDPYISFNIADTQFADLAAFEEWFAENAVGGSGGSSSGLTPSEVQEMIDESVSGKADASATTVDEYSIYATRDSNVSTAYTSVPITWVKIVPKGSTAKSGSLQFSGVTGYLYIQNIDYVNGTYTVGSGSLDPSLVSGLSITFEDGAMIVEVDASNPITYATFTNTVIEYVKTVIPEKVASDAIYDNVYPLIKKVDNSLTSVTINSASTVQQEIGIRQTKNEGGSTNQIVSLDGYLSYSGTTLKAEAYVNTGTDTLTTVAPTINSSSRTDYFFVNNVGQTAESNHIEIEILTGDTINLAFYGYDNTGRLTSRSLVVSGGTVTSGYGWPSEATYSLSNGVLTVDYAYTGTSAGNPLTINRIMATNNYGSTASVSDIVGYVKALLKDKVEVTEYIENTLKPTINGIEDSEEVIAQSINVLSDSLSGKQDTLLFYSEEDNTQDGSKDARIETTIEDTESGIVRTAYVESLVNDTTPFATLNAHTEVNNNEESYQRNADIYADDGGVYLSYQTQDDIEQTNYNAQLNINGDGISLNVDNEEDSVSLNVTTDGISLNVYNGEDAASFNVTAEGVTINGDEIVTESDLTASLSGKQDTLIAGSGITISGNVISADGGASDPNKLDVTAFTAYSAATATAISGKANASDVVSISDYDEAQRVTATALNDLNDRFGGMTLRKLTQAQYDALSGNTDSNTLYIITNVVNNA